MKKVVCLDTNETFDNYKDYLNGDHWKIVKKEFYNTNERKCNKCSSEKELHIHHLTYKNIGNESMSDLVCLCKDCHFKLHKQADTIKPKKKKKKKKKLNNKKVNCKDCKMFKFDYYCDAFKRSAHYMNRPKECKKYKKKPIK